MLADGTGRELQIATAFFVSKDMRLNQEFLNEASKTADVVSVDFKQPSAASRTITKWAKEKTKGGLKLDELSFAPATKVAMTSAIYFKGNWVYTFQPAKPGTFHTPGGPVACEMMNMKRKFRWGKIGDYAQWTAIQYESQDSLIIILPNEGQNLDDVINRITASEIDDVMYRMDSDNANADVNITLPKFNLESTTNLIEPYRKVT